MFNWNENKGFKPGDKVRLHPDFIQDAEGVLRYMSCLVPKKIYVVDRPDQYEHNPYIHLKSNSEGCSSVYQCYFIHAKLSNSERMKKRMEELCLK